MARLSNLAAKALGGNQNPHSATGRCRVIQGVQDGRIFIITIRGSNFAVEIPKSGFFVVLSSYFGIIDWRFFFLMPGNQPYHDKCRVSRLRRFGTGATISANIDLNLGQDAERYVMEKFSLVTQVPLEMLVSLSVKPVPGNWVILHSSFHSSKVPHPLVGITALGASLR